MSEPDGRMIVGAPREGALDGDWAARGEAAILAAALPLIPRLGWTRRALRAAAGQAGMSETDAELLLPGGPRDLAALLAADHDRRTLARLAAIDPASLKIRERIRVAVLARLETAMLEERAVRRWMGFLALPANAALGGRLLWASADRLWRWAGDVAADENHYTKRALLSEILFSTLAVRLAAGAGAAERLVDRRIAGVMSFERWKATRDFGATGRRLATALARWRYGAEGMTAAAKPTISPP